MENRSLVRPLYPYLAKSETPPPSHEGLISLTCPDYLYQALIRITDFYRNLSSLNTQFNKLLLSDLQSCFSNGLMTFAPPHVPLLASVEAFRPVFMIVMGAFLLLTAWRMTRGTTGWTPRLLLGGAFLLALGYSVLLPLYQAGVLLPLSLVGRLPGDPAVALGWHIVKVVSMNGGWLLFGLGLALHAGIFETERSPAPVETPTTSPLNGPLA